MAHNLDVQYRIKAIQDVLQDHELNSAEYTEPNGHFYELSTSKREAGWLAVQKQAKAEAVDLLKRTWDAKEGLVWKAQARLEASRQKALASIDAGLDFTKLMYHAQTLPARIERMQSLSELQAFYDSASPAERRVIQDSQPVITRKWHGTEPTIGGFLGNLTRDLEASRHTPALAEIDQDQADLEADTATLHQLSLAAHQQIDPGAFSRVLRAMNGVQPVDVFDPQIGGQRTTFRPREDTGIKEIDVAAIMEKENV